MFYPKDQKVPKVKKNVYEINTINLVTSTVVFYLYFLKVKTENRAHLKQNEEKDLFPVFCRTMTEKSAALAITGHTIAPENSCCVFLQ